MTRHLQPAQASTGRLGAPAPQYCHTTVVGCLQAEKHLHLTLTAVQVMWVEASELEQPAHSGDDKASAASTSSAQGAWERLQQADGILVPGGFGQRGVEGMVAAASYARRNGIPYLGICLGMQACGPA